jgi:hypothetical protein
LERGTKDIGVPAEKVRGALYAPFCSLAPISKHGLFIGGIKRVNAQRLHEVRKHFATRNIEPLFEERITQSEAEGLARLYVFAIGGMGACKCREGGCGKVLGVKPSEEAGSCLRAQLSHMLGCSFCIKRFSIDEFKRPCPDVEKDVFTPQLSSTLNDTAESDVRKRAPHVCVDLDDVHFSKSKRGATEDLAGHQ